MWRLVCGLIAAVIGLLASSAGAQTPNPRVEVQKGVVSVLTDGITDPDSRGTRAINQLAAYASRMPNVRVLPISGHGGAGNARDLLYLRGVDFAVINSDVITFLEQTGQYADVRRRLRYVTSLFDQKVFLLVRNEIKTIEDLRGRKLAVLADDGPGYVTAKALFGLHKIDVAIGNTGPGRVLDDATLSRFDGALLLSDELARARLSSRVRQDYYLLPIRMTPDLQKTYRSAVISAQEGAGFSNGANVETVTVSTLLAGFNWTPSQTRYADVTNFIAALFQNLKGLRQAPDSIWRQTDIAAQNPGWVRFPASLPQQVLTPAQLAELAVVERPAATMGSPVAAIGLDPTPNPGAARRIKVLAALRAPLADPHLPDGGLITALLSASLRMADKADAGHIEIDLNWTSGPPTLELLQGESAVDLSLPWESADCEQPNDLAQQSAIMCDDVLYSEPLLQLIIGLYALSDGDFNFNTDESIFGKSICVSQDRDVSILNGDGRKWISERRISVVRRPTLLDCISLVQQREADAFMTSDLEGRHTLEQLGLSSLFKMMERPLGTRGVHVIVPKERPQAEALINTINQGLKLLRQSDAYASIVRQHLMKLWNTHASVP